MKNIDVQAKAKIFNSFTRAMQRGFDICMYSAYGFDNFGEETFVLKLRKGDYAADLMVEDQENIDIKIQDWLTEKEIDINTKISYERLEEMERNED